MILNQCNFFSKVLDSHVDVDILIPSMPDGEVLYTPLAEVYRRAAGQRWPVLYLLHGTQWDHTGWIRETNIERYAEKAGIMVVMPSGQNGFYVNARSGLDYGTFITEELPAFVETFFHASAEPADRYIAGASMGGYGAARCALLQPERYAAFADISGAVDLPELAGKMKDHGYHFFRSDLVFGDLEKISGTDQDVYALAARDAEAPVRPRAYIYCGTDDDINYDMNLRLARELRKDRFEVLFRDGPGGHGWAYWDTCIADFLSCVQPQQPSGKGGI